MKKPLLVHQKTSHLKGEANLKFVPVIDDKGVPVAYFIINDQIPAKHARENARKYVECVNDTPTFINRTWTNNTGGGTMVDYVELSTGVVLAITDESVVAYSNADLAEEGDDQLAEMRLDPKTWDLKNQELAQYFNSLNLTLAAEQFGYTITEEENAVRLRVYMLYDDVAPEFRKSFSYTSVADAEADAAGLRTDGYSLKNMNPSSEKIRVDVRGGVAYCEDSRVEIVDHDDREEAETTLKMPKVLRDILEHILHEAANINVRMPELNKLVSGEDNLLEAYNEFNSLVNNGSAAVPFRVAYEYSNKFNEWVVSQIPNKTQRAILGKYGEAKITKLFNNI